VIVPAHGIGGRADLPLPGDVVLQAGGFVVLVSFLVVGLMWKRPKFATVVAGRPLPEVLQRAADSARLRLGLQGLTLLGWVYLVLAGFAGPPSTDDNPAPRALYVLFWVGVVPASLLLGPVWRVLNPFRALHALLAAALLCIQIRNTPRPDARPAAAGQEPMRIGMQSKAVLDRLGYWPAAAGLAVFVWLELVPEARAEPHVVGGFLLVYGAATTAAGLVFGPRWFERGDPFEVYSSLVAALAPYGRDDTGRLTWRNPLRGLTATAPGAGLVAVLAVWWGSTVFDGVSGTTWWVNVSQRAGGGEWLGTGVLVGLIVLVWASYRLCTGRRAEALVSTLVPIAVGYTIAHYVSLLVSEGPRGLALLVGVDAAPVYPHPTAIAVVQVTAILVGHVAGVVAAHDRVLALDLAAVPVGGAERRPGNQQLAEQVPLVLIMIVYTMIGLYLLVIA
jgi:hypothetical protein